MNNLIIYGTGKMAELICYSFIHDSPYEVVAFCVDDAYVKPEGGKLLDIPIYNFGEIQKLYPPSENKMHVAIGRNSARTVIYNNAKTAGYSFANYISSKANFWPDLTVGENVFIDQCCDIQPFVTIGNNCMLIGSRIGHHSKVHDNVLLSGNILAGNVTIGKNSFLGINSAVKEDIVIGENNIVGAGVFINKNTEDNKLISNPATPQRVSDSKRFVLFNKGVEVKQA
ncbi:acetyltransferase [Pedobacter sandarakinus]|uniref:acetyltransferase n=1 Tax=Pedobacter sandarakinus TaxID=353156 RepID=UPI002245EB06|nr:acetyltransferase [Pedobacter sandarakinus]MCX2574291.1 acetyltransferase [Pedobacter sandarakinus]